MQVTLETRYTDGSTHFRTTVEVASEIHALSWAIVNWHPAQGIRRVDGPGFYLNPALLVSVDGGEFEPVADVLARSAFAERQAA